MLPSYRAWMATDGPDATGRVCLRARGEDDIVLIGKRNLP